MLLPFNRCSKTGTISIDAGGTIWSDVTGTSCVIYPLENKSLRQRYYEAEKHIKNLVNERGTLAQIRKKIIPHWMTTEGYEQLISYINHCIPATMFYQVSIWFCQPWLLL